LRLWNAVGVLGDGLRCSQPVRLGEDAGLRGVALGAPRPFAAEGDNARPSTAPLTAAMARLCEGELRAVVVRRGARGERIATATNILPTCLGLAKVVGEVLQRLGRKR
jgi:hypothetical protein